MRARSLGAALLRGIRPVERRRILPDAVAGLTLAALAIPEVLGYARIAGMPLETGLYTLFVPVVAFAVLGASRHLVVGADSATAAILAVGLGVLAAPGSPRYVELAGVTAVLVAVLLLVARLARLGFLSQFLSRTVLVGFLTGVGVLVAAGQVGAMLGIPEGPGTGPGSVVGVLGTLPMTQLPTLVVSVSVVAFVLALRRVSRRIPAALVAMVASVAAAMFLRLPEHGVAVLGPVAAGLPSVTFPSMSAGDVGVILPIAASMVLVVLAQSAATSRAYADRHDERVDTDGDVVGLAGANLAAALTGSFVVNGSPTKTEMVDGAGGRSQLAQLVTAAVVGVVLLTSTGLLSALPLAALSAVVFLIGVDLIDLRELRRLYAVRREEFVVAVVTAAAVVGLGVEIGIVVAVVASIVDHLRHSYSPRNSVLHKSPAGHWQSAPVLPGGRTIEGLVVYRFGTGLYFANAARLDQDVRTLMDTGAPPLWFCLDAAAVGDVDYTAGRVFARVHHRLSAAGTRLVLSNVSDPVRGQVERYLAGTGPVRVFDTSGEALEAFLAEHPPAAGPR